MARFRMPFLSPPRPRAADRLAQDGDPVQIVSDWYLKDLGDPSCTVATSDGRSCGDLHALYRIASITKLFMTLAARNLEARGRIDLDLGVTAATELDLPPEFDGLTLRDMLQHRSGLPRELMRLSKLWDGIRALNCGMFGTHIYAGLERMPGLLHELWCPVYRKMVRSRTGDPTYSNVGYGLGWLGIVKQLDMSLAQILEETILSEYGLRETTFDPRTRPDLKVLEPCAGSLPWFYPRGHRIPEHPLGPVFASGGGLYASASDCIRIANAYWPVVDEALVACAQRPPADGAMLVGMTARRVANGRLILTRSGMLYGGSSFLSFDVAKRRVAVILRNVTEWPDDVGVLLMNRL